MTTPRKPIERTVLLIRAACLALLVASCGRDDKVVIPPWNQFHGDVANSGQILIGTTPAKETGLISAQIGRTEWSSPVIAPDGSVYITIYSATPGPAGTALLRLSTAGAITVSKRLPREGQLSTPAVDAAGNVYVTQFIDPNSDAHLLSFGPNDQPRWDLPLGKGKSLAPPKVLEMSDGSVVFQSYSGGTPVGGHVLIAYDQGKQHIDQYVCGVFESGIQPPGFHVSPVPLPPPYPEGPAVAIRGLQGERGMQYYLVVATDACGLSFYRLDFGATSAAAPTLTTIKVLDSNPPQAYSAPAVSADGTVVISDSNKRVAAYDITTGNEKWHYDAAAYVSATPTFLPLAINFVYVASYDKLIKLDLTTGQVVAERGIIGPTDGSPAAGGENIFVSTVSGVFTYDLDLNLRAFSPLAGGRSSPAIDYPSGKVYVAATDGWFYSFAGP